MHGSRIGVLLVAAAALAACSSNQRYSVSHATPTATTPYPGNTTYYAPTTSYTPAPVVGPGMTSVTYDLSRTDRQSAETAALRYCADQGRSAAFRSIDGYAITYDCIPTTGYPTTGYGTAMMPASAVPSVTYQDLGGDPLALQADASRFCARQGLGTVYRGRDGDRVVYDCVGNVAMMPSATMSGSSMPVATPQAVPLITYETAGDLRSTADQPAIKYCGQLGLSPVLRDKVGRRVTYECR
jgi:hypothetical protein